MTDLLTLAQARVPELRRVGREWHGPCPECGAGKSGPGKTDRFSVKDDGRWFCRSCAPSGGDAVAFLRRFESMSCPEAHAALGKECASTTCPVLDKCRKGSGKTRRDESSRRTPQPRADRPAWRPDPAATPAQQWQQNAAVLVEWAHKRLLSEPDQLAYLAGRGLPIEAVRKYRLGWWPVTKFRSLPEWGLPEEKNEQGRARKLWIPRGIVIPTFNGETIDRIRIRRHKDDLEDGRGKYIALKGSGDEVPVIGEGRRAFVVVEADLDGLLIDWCAGDLVGSVPLASCSVKPRSRAYAVLKDALALLVALDFEPRVNERTGKPENPGGQSARWWLEHFPRAERWPVPVGKDPGEAFEAGVDLRKWILAGLPPAFHVAKAVPSPESRVQSPESKEPGPGTLDPRPGCVAIAGVSQGGREYIVAHDSAAAARLVAAGDPRPAFAPCEIEPLRGLPQAVNEEVLMVKEIFPGATVLETLPYHGDPRERKVIKFDPSQQRRVGDRK